MKFIMAYSGGKDCTLALDRMIREGNECVALVVLANEHGVSFNHALAAKMLQGHGRCFGIPVEVVRAPVLHDFNPLRGAAGAIRDKYNAQAVCFGDIDLLESRHTNTALATAINCEAVFPLWQNDRRALLNELCERGYKCIVKSLDTELLPEELLGREIDDGCIAVFEQAGIDICGENGEYHSLAIDGPLFKYPLSIEVDRIFRKGSFSSLLFRF